MKFKTKYQKWALTGIVVTIVIVAFVLFAPIIPIQGAPQQMGSSCFGSYWDLQMKFPDNQPTTLPVYKITDYIEISDYLDPKTHQYNNPADPDAHDLKSITEHYAKIIREDYDLPMPEDEFAEDTGFTYARNDYWPREVTEWRYTIHPKIDNMKVFPLVGSITYKPGETGFATIGYTGYRIEKVGEIKIESAQEAYNQIETGNDISFLSRDIDDKTKHVAYNGWLKGSYNTVELKWEYPTGAEYNIPHTGEYLIPVWEFRTIINGESKNLPCSINAVEGGTEISWSPEGNPKFTPNKRFYELKDQKTRRWIDNPDWTLGPKTVEVYADTPINTPVNV